MHRLDTYGARTSAIWASVSALVAGLVLGGCSLFQPLETPCTADGCGADYTRIQRDGTCVCRLSTQYSADAGVGDAGPLDAGPMDAGPADAGPLDAGPADAGRPSVYVVIRTNTDENIAPNSQVQCAVVGATRANFGPAEWRVNGQDIGLPEDDTIVVPPDTPIGSRLRCSMEPGFGYTPPDDAVLSVEHDVVGQPQADAIILANGVYRPNAYAGETLECRGISAMPLDLEMRYAETDDAALAAPVAQPVLSQTGHYYCVDRANPDTVLTSRWAMPKPRVEQLFAGDTALCALYSSGHIRCAGTGPMAGAPRASSAPVFIDVEREGLPSALLTDVREAAAGHTHACADHANNGVVCWGENARGQLGTRDTNDSPIARVVMFGDTEATPLENMVALALGARHTCATNTDQRVLCWGDGTHNQLGVAVQSGMRAFARMIPVDGSDVGLEHVGDLWAGADHNCAVRSEDIDGQTISRALCWGRNDARQLGAIHAGENARALDGPAPQHMALGQSHACALVGDEVLCWGDSSGGRLGDTEGTRLVVQSDAVSHPNLLGDSMDTHADVTCIQHDGPLDAPSRLTCWGDNTHHVANPELGPGTARDNVVFTHDGQWTFTLGSGFGCVLVKSGDQPGVRCWGTPTGDPTGTGWAGPGMSAPLDAWEWPGRPGPG